MSEKPKGPAIDPSDMASNQSAMFGVSTFNVKQQEQAAENSVKIPTSQFAVDTSVNQSFVDAAPNLPFDLPFHIQRFFGGKVPDDSK